MSDFTIAFAGARLLALGPEADVRRVMNAALAAGETGAVIHMDAVTSRHIEPLPPEPVRGRPKLGVTAREVTLLPRHWEWLAEHGGASSALRRLVEAARKAEPEAEALRRGRDSLYRFSTVLAGDAPGYEEAIRALYAGDRAGFERETAPWPADVRDHALRLADEAFLATPTDPLTLIPEARREAVRAALGEAFGPAPLDRVQPLAPGASGASVYRLGMAGGDWVLRLAGTADPWREPAHHHACMAMAAVAGVAPAVIQADAEEGLSISRFVAARPADPPLSRHARLSALAKALRRLHAAPLFPSRTQGGDQVEALDQIVKGFTTSGLASGPLAARLTAFWAALAPRCASEEAPVSCHNDLNPSNIILDGARPWFVDWEVCGPGDRYVDLAAVANWFCADEAEVDHLVEVYFEGSPSPDTATRLSTLRQFNRLLFGVLLTMTAAAAGETRPMDEADIAASPALAAIRGDMAIIATAAGRRQFGTAFLAEALRRQAD